MRLFVRAALMGMVVVGVVMVSGCEFLNQKAKEKKVDETIEQFEKDQKEVEKKIVKEEEPQTTPEPEVTTESKPEEDGGEEVKVEEEKEDPMMINYSEKKYNELLGKEAFALYFHADWCPVCFALNDAISKELPNLPKGTKILKVDYDDSDELQKTYKITSQATVVYIDGSGTALGTDMNPSMERLKEMLGKSLQ